MNGLNRDDIIRMARKAGLINDCDGVYFRDQDSFERFAALVAAAEREECAKVALDYDQHAIAPAAIAAAIRSRGK